MYPQLAPAVIHQADEHGETRSMSIDPRCLVRAPAHVLRQPSTRQAARVTVSFAMVISLLVGLFSSGVLAVTTVGATNTAANLDQCADGVVGPLAVACTGYAC